jgi:hypothetical protein
MAVILKLTLKTAPDADGKFALTDGTNDYQGQIPEDYPLIREKYVRQFAIDKGRELMKERRIAARKAEKAAKPFNIDLGATLFKRTDEDEANELNPSK